MRILFFDVSCPKPYDAITLDTEALGGTEASVVRVAEGLAASGCVVNVQQHCREESYVADVCYLPIEDADPEIVVALRDLKLLPYLKDKYPKAKLYLWLHDIGGEELTQNVELLDNIGATLVCVSQWHKKQVIEKLMAGGYDGRGFKVTYVYNPIDDGLVPNGEPYDKNKLVFFSSPHKGLEDALAIFSSLWRRHSKMHLYIANPGYFKTHDTKQENVHILGAIAHSEVIAHVRSSLAVFYPNGVFPETFGLVFAEANAVGTPVLTFDIGAAKEILDSPQYELVEQNEKAVVDTIMSWRDGARPTVRGKKDFRLSRVLAEWKALLADS